MSESPTSVVIVGAGPTGLFLALRLAQAGVDFKVIEEKSQLDESTKSLTHMPAIFPEYGRAGILDEVLEAAGALRSTGVAFRRSSDKSIIAETPANVPGRPGPCILPQGQFSRTLLEKIRQHDRQQVLFDHAFEGFREEAGGGVTVSVKTGSGQRSAIKARYIIAADGGKSAVRKAVGIPLEGETLPYQLVATDLIYRFEAHGWAPTMANFLAGEHPGLIGPIDGKSLWRCSFGMPLEAGANPTPDSVESAIQSKFEQMLPAAPGEKPQGWEVTHVAPYKAQQLCAQTFRRGPIILIGDAAHLTNPYAGMGLNTGIFDAASLADALICVLQRGGGADSLLDAWSAARRAVFLKIVDPMSRAAFAALRDPDVDSLAQRHPLLKAMKMKGAKPPQLGTDVSEFNGWAAA